MIVGMMALFAGVGRVPIAVILMVSEMTGSFALLVPSMVAVVISYFATGPKHSIYKSQVPRRSDSPAHSGEYNVPLLTRIFVSDAMSVNVSTVSPSDTVAAAQQLMLDKGFSGVPVVESQKLVGIVTLGDLQRVPAEQMGSKTIDGVMTRNPLATHPDESLLDAMDKMTNDRVGRLPVVSKESSKLVGIVTMSDLIRTYQKAVKALSASEPA